MKTTRTILLLTALLLTAVCATLPAAEPMHWVGTWGAAPSPQISAVQPRQRKLEFTNQTLREVVHASIGGDTVRVRLSNAFASEGVEIGAAHIALRSTGSDIVAGSDRALTFGGRPTVRIPANAVVLSDPVKLTVPAAGDLAISIFVPATALGGGIHYQAAQTAWIASGDATSAAALTNPTTIPSWVFLTGVDVLAPETTNAIVTIGDSITDGARSTTDANRRWPDVLAGRLAAQKSRNKFSVLNMGIGANRILNGTGSAGIPALARFDADVLAQPNVKYLIILEGINDIGHSGENDAPITVDDIIGGLKQMIERAHEHGIKVFGATLTPFEGESQTSRKYYTPEKGKMRETINEWIRNGKAYDGVIDFDKAVRDPKSPNTMLHAFDSGDQLHPNDSGYKTMGDSIDLNLFK